MGFHEWIVPPKWMVFNAKPKLKWMILGCPHSRKSPNRRERVHDIFESELWWASIGFLGGLVSIKTAKGGCQKAGVYTEKMPLGVFESRRFTWFTQMIPDVWQSLWGNWWSEFGVPYLQKPKWARCKIRTSPPKTNGETRWNIGARFANDSQIEMKQLFIVSLQ